MGLLEPVVTVIVVAIAVGYVVWTLLPARARAWTGRLAGRAADVDRLPQSVRRALSRYAAAQSVPTVGCGSCRHGAPRLAGKGRRPTLVE